jgi:hypothetical protein
MNQTSTILVVCGVALLVLVVVMFGLLAVGAGGSFESYSSEPIRMRQPPDDGSTGVVYDTHKEGPDVALWSWQIVSPRYTAVVGFVAPEGCDVQLGDKFVRSGPCASAPAEGEVRTGGVTKMPNGLGFVVLSVSIDKQCFEVLRVNDIWPSTHAACPR